MAKGELVMKVAASLRRQRGTVVSAIRRYGQLGSVETAKYGNSKAYRTTILNQTERPPPVRKAYNGEPEGNGKTFYRNNDDK